MESKIEYHQREHCEIQDSLGKVEKIIFINCKPSLLDRFWMMCKNFDKTGEKKNGY